MSSSRDRSASPVAESKAKKAKTSGFKWKDTKTRDHDAAQSQDRGLERGYRDRSPRRDQRREREDPSQGKIISPPQQTSANVPNRDDLDSKFGSTSDATRRGRDDMESKFGPRAARSTVLSNPSVPPSAAPTAAPVPVVAKPKKKPTVKPAVPNEPMIIVNINDRLGTKAAIPCLASDSVKAFRAIVAAHIGRQPHEIMIKRQGERPFKDVLTLEDYGVSSGVQLDLEIDTGD